MPPSKDKHPEPTGRFAYDGLDRLIHERMRRGAEASWEEFAAANPDLLTWRPSILAAYYREETLRSDLARASFVLPDRLASPPPPRPAPASGSASSP